MDWLSDIQRSRVEKLSNVYTVLETLRDELPDRHPATSTLEKARLEVSESSLRIMEERNPGGQARDAE